jgi:hypothetical protein
MEYTELRTSIKPTADADRRRRPADPFPLPRPLNAKRRPADPPTRFP